MIVPAAAQTAAPAAQASASHSPALHLVMVKNSGARPASGSRNCSSGYVCMYSPGEWISGEPGWSEEVYGCYNLDDYTGTWYVLNNQTGGAWVRGYDGYNCSGKVAFGFPAVAQYPENLTPVNSIGISPS